MIRYELRCGADHRFEGWFRSGANYDEQRAAGTLSCPACGSGAVDKAPMAPAVARGRSEIPAARPDPMTMLRAIRREIEAKCEHVGSRFAEEARKIHYGEADARGIYGDATRDEASALADEGIEIAAIPWVPTADN